MKVLIIFPPVHPVCDSLGMRSMPPLSIYYLSAILRNRGVDVRVIDPTYFHEQSFFSSYNNSVKMIKEFTSEHYDVITISANSGNWSIAKILIELFKEVEKEIPIVVGGIHASYFDDYVLKTTDADFIIRGEGEEILPQLLEILDNEDDLSKLKGISYRNKEGEIIRNPDAELIEQSKLDLYPLPDYNLLPKGYYNNIPIETSRGCKYNCLFCSVPYRKTWRPVKKEKVLERIYKVKDIVDNGTTVGNSIYLVDDCFSADTKRALDILNTLDTLDLNLKYGMECRITDLLTPGFIEQIPKHLISFIQIGVELGYDEGLRMIRKGVTVNQIEECSKLLNKYGLLEKAHYSFILGFPWEDVNQIEKTIHFFGYLGNTYGIRSSVSWLGLCPSDLWYTRKKYNINVGEEIFDNPYWIVSKDLFLLTHPKIDINAYDRIEKLIDVYKSNGVNIFHPSLFL